MWYMALNLYFLNSKTKEIYFPDLKPSETFKEYFNNKRRIMNFFTKINKISR